ncbi:MAG: gamma-glutamylcyclotransferase family protein [Chloroflexota bacterium]
MPYYAAETIMYYFAYGSNLNRKQMLERCPESKPRFTATLSNYQLVFVGWSRQWRGGVASIKTFRGGKVLGAVYEVSDRDLRRLDSYEGYPRDANRLKVTVFDEDGEPIQAITYIKTGQLEETMPSPEYLSVIQQGYRDWGIV